MKKVLVPYAAYNLWAHQQMLQRLKELPDEVLRTKVPNSFESIFNTVQHLLDAESMWWQRMKLLENVKRPSDGFSGDFSELSKEVLQQATLWQQWVSEAQDRAFDHEFIYYNTKKEKFKQPIYEMLLHVFNHSTYHRGQLVTILHQLKINNIPNTDFIAWSRKK